MKRTLLFSLTFFCFFAVSAQFLKGKILTSTGESVPYATIYIHENTSGIVADEQGKFQIKLKAGKYTCEVRSIGFETQLKTVDVSANGSEIQIILPIKTHGLKEVVVKPSKEDPAYPVMRHAIARAPFHLFQVSGFTSENYLKGSAKIEKIPGLMKMMISDKKLLGLIGKLMVLESQNEITFQSPAKYTQKVIAYKSSIPKEMEPKGGIRIPTSSVYEVMFMDEISPLSPQAFRYYQFKLDDIFSSGNYQVNKIRIIPKVKNTKLFSGYIYILEDNWSVYSVDLTESEMGTTTRTKINYQEVQPFVFMPITYDIYTNIGTMGVKGYARFYSSVKYKNIKVNESANLAKTQKSTEKNIQPVSKKQQKVLDKIDELSAKDKISTRDALKLARLTTSVIEPIELKEQHKSLEIKDVEKVKMEIDSMATKRDSTFWEDIRNVPLQADEAQSLRKKDTTEVSKSVKTTGNSIEINLGNNKKPNLLMGGSIELGKATRLSFDGLLKGALKEYNFVDGLWLGQKLSLNINTSKTSSLVISPYAYYTSARKSIVWSINSQYQYAPLVHGLLRLGFGNKSEDIQHDKGTSRFFNSLSSLFLGDNVIRFYQDKYFNIENQIDISNGLQFNAGLSYENRQLLSNNTTYHFFGNAPQSNYPNQTYSDAFPTNFATTAWLRIEFTPYMKYRIKDGKKEYAGSVYPTFDVSYKKAIPLLDQAEQASYDKIKLSVRQSISLSEFDKLNYNVSFGAFLTKKKIYAPDLNYFATNPLLITDKYFDNSFSLQENYANSNSRWLETYLNWTSDYLLLKQLGFLQKYLFNESLQLHLLWSEQYKIPYSEIGYSIGFNKLGRIGIFAGFEGTNYKNFGVKVSVPMFFSLGKR